MDTLPLLENVRFTYECPDTKTKVSISGRMIYLDTIVNNEEDEQKEAVEVYYPVIKLFCPCGEVHIFADSEVELEESDFEIGD